MSQACPKTLRERPENASQERLTRAPHGSASRERLTGPAKRRMTGSNNPSSGLIIPCQTPDDGFIQPVIRPYNSPAKRQMTGSSNPSSGFIIPLQKRRMTGSSNPSSGLIIPCKTPDDGFEQPAIWPYDSPAKRRMTGSSNPSSGIIIPLQNAGRRDHPTRHPT